MNTISIPTSRYIELAYPVASLTDRLIAYGIDVAIMAVYFSIWILLGTENLFSTSFWESANVLIFLPISFYSIFWEAIFNGRTPGKWIMKTQVIMLSGKEANLSAYLLRWSLRLVDVWFTSFLLIPGLIGIVFIGVKSSNQRLGDILAGTTVIKLTLSSSFDQTIFVETEDYYQPKYIRVRELSDKDAIILKEILDAGIQYDNEALLIRLANKVCQVLDIESDEEPKEFLKTILKDYNYYFS